MFWTGHFLSKRVKSPVTVICESLKSLFAVFLLQKKIFFLVLKVKISIEEFSSRHVPVVKMSERAFSSKLGKESVFQSFLVFFESVRFSATKFSSCFFFKAPIFQILVRKNSVWSLKKISTNSSLHGLSGSLWLFSYKL